MIFVYPKVSDVQIRRDGKKLLKQVKQFFLDNPRRRVAHVEVWYGKVIHIKKNEIDQIVSEAVEAALAK